MIKPRKQRPVNYEMVNYVKSVVGAEMIIDNAEVHNKWLVCTLNPRKIRMATYKETPHLAASITFRVRNY